MSAHRSKIEARRIEAQRSPDWTGDALDDCVAKWAGFSLRAEEMKKGVWWYAVTDIESGLSVVDSTVMQNDAPDGTTARSRCEAAARSFLGDPPPAPTDDRA